MKQKIATGLLVVLLLFFAVYFINSIFETPPANKIPPVVLQPPAVPVAKQIIPSQPATAKPRPETSEKAAALKKIIGEKIVNVDAYFNLGNTYYSLKRYAEAEEAYRKVLDAQPRDYQAYNGIGNCYNALGAYAKAVSAYQSSIGINQDNFNAYNNLGNTYRNMGANEKALAAYKKASALKPGSPDAYYNIGVTYGLLGQKEQARDMLSKAKELYREKNNAAGTERAERSLQNL
jgi:tetratricopeptide (TPR) repeat protein